MTMENGLVYSETCIREYVAKYKESFTSSCVVYEICLARSYAAAAEAEGENSAVAAIVFLQTRY